MSPFYEAALRGTLELKLGAGGQRPHQRPACEEFVGLLLGSFQGFPKWYKASFKGFPKGHEGSFEEVL